MAKRLYRNLDDKKIGGVCSGIGDYLDADPLVIRIIFMVGFFTFVTLPFWLYIFVWILAPGVHAGFRQGDYGPTVTFGNEPKPEEKAAKPEEFNNKEEGHYQK